MPYREIVGLLSGLLFFAAFVPYLWAIWKGNAKPSLATWLVWAVVDTIVLYGMYEADSMNYQIIGATIGAWSVFLSALVRGTSEWSKLDKLALGAAIICMVLWQIFNDPLIAIILRNAIILIGGWPTIVSAAKEPQNEDAIAWGMFAVSCLMSVYAIPELSLEHMVQPLTFLAVDGTVAFLVIAWPLLRRQATA